MGVKLKEAVDRTGAHYSWLWVCPACRTVHQCDKRWTFNGDREKPTFRASVLVEAHEPNRPRCHSFVTDGRIAFCEDSTHEMAGKTVDLPDWDDTGYADRF